MWTAKRRRAEDVHDAKTRDRLRRLVVLEANVMAGDPDEVETRLRQMTLGAKSKPT